MKNRKIAITNRAYLDIIEVNQLKLKKKLRQPLDVSFLNKIYQMKNVSTLESPQNLKLFFLKPTK